MSIGWMAVAVGLAVAILVIATAWFRRHEDFDLGTVSHQWIAEQRFGHQHDARR